MHAAQVLLTSFDLSVRMHYLNARQALRRLLEWRAVPVVNENDTTATDEITFGDNDFLSAQLALLLGARLLVLLTDTDGLHTADPQRDPDGASGSRGVDDFAELDALRDRRPHLALRLRRACAARSRRPGWRAPPGSRRRSATGPRRARCSRRRAARTSGRGSSPHPERTPSFKLWLRYAKPARGRVRRRRGRRAGAARERLEPAAGRDRRRRGRVRRRRRGRRRLRRRPGRQGDRQLLFGRAGEDQGNEVRARCSSCCRTPPRRPSTGIGSCSRERGVAARGAASVRWRRWPCLGGAPRRRGAAVVAASGAGGDGRATGPRSGWRGARPLERRPRRLAGRR